MRRSARNRLKARKIGCANFTSMIRRRSAYQNVMRKTADGHQLFMSDSSMRDQRFPRGTLALIRAFAFFFCLCLLPVAAFAGYDRSGLRLPPGFQVSLYVTGSGFHQDQRGIPAVVAMAFDPDGALYFARTANRLKEIYGRTDARIYRVPPGAAKVTAATEKQFLFGPLLDDPDELAVNRHGQVFVSTSHAAGYGSIYRLKPNGASALFAGGPAASGKPLLQDPEGIAFDKADNVYVVDSGLGVVVKLNENGKVLNPRWLTGIGRGRTLTIDSKDNLWIGSDGSHDSEHIDRHGEILRVQLSSGKRETIYSGALPSGMSFSPGGHLFVAQRRSHKLFALAADGKRVEFATFSGRAALRTLAFPPVNEHTRKLGIAGDLFVMVFPVLDYPVREVIRISGPFDDFVRRGTGGKP
jgi:sugar lactone lactonase YvrE